MLPRNRYDLKYLRFRIETGTSCLKCIEATQNYRFFESWTCGPTCGWVGNPKKSKVQLFKTAKTSDIF